METYETEKINAYNWLAGQGIIPKNYFGERQKDFETGDIFKYAIPNDKEDAERAIAGLVSRVKTAIEILSLENNILKIETPESFYEICSLEVLSVIILSLKVPDVFDWQVDSQSKGHFALLLGTIWCKETKWLPYWIQQVEGEPKITPVIIAKFILDSIEKPEKKSGRKMDREKMSLSEAFYKSLVYKAKYWTKQKRREVSLDKNIPNPKSDDRKTTYTDMLRDPKAEVEIFHGLDRKLFLAWLEKICTPKGKNAILKSLNDEELDPTERRAYDRQVQKTRKYCKEHNIKSPF